MEEFKYLIPEESIDAIITNVEKLREIENHLRHVFSNYGYNEVLMPSFEYVDLYTKLDCGFTVDKMFQYINHEGKNVAMRLDFTIPLARLYANSANTGEARYSYFGKVYRKETMHKGRSSEFFQGGVELMNKSGLQGDKEVMTMIQESLPGISLKNILLELGSAKFYNRLLELVGNQRNELEDILRLRDISEMKRFISKNDFEESTEYQSVLDIKIIEVKNLARYLNMPHISTQHGVKGESHSSVIFMASDNNSTPNVRMYPFFELWSNLEFSLPQFETLFYSYNRLIEKVEAELGMKISELTAETHNKSEKNKAILVRYSNEVLEKYQGNILFDALCKDDFISYLAKQNVGNAKKIFKITKMEGILTAYKLFYVGCSRAKENLVIVIDENKIAPFRKEFIKRMTAIGFDVNGI